MVIIVRNVGNVGPSGSSYSPSSVTQPPTDTGMADLKRQMLDYAKDAYFIANSKGVKYEDFDIQAAAQGAVEYVITHSSPGFSVSVATTLKDKMVDYVEEEMRKWLEKPQDVTYSAKKVEKVFEGVGFVFERHRPAEKPARYWPIISEIGLFPYATVLIILITLLLIIFGRR